MTRWNAHLSTVVRTAQDVLRNVSQRCVTSMLPVRHIQDRNTNTRVAVEDSICLYDTILLN